jgi:hypothetical protein
MRSTILAALAALLALGAPLAALAQTPLHGEWTLSRSAHGNTVRMTVRTDDGEEDGQSSLSIEGAHIGLSAADLDSAGKHVTFDVVRDAGTFACEGWVGGGHGAGTLTFAPSATYAAALQSRGIAPISPREQLAAAMLDLSLAYIDDIARAGYPHLPIEKLIAFRALGVTSAAIAGLRATFHDALSEEQVVSLTALHVTPAYVADLAALGISGLNAQGAVQMKALGIDRSYVDAMAKAGYPHLDERDLVQLKALGVDDDYIHHLAAHGFHDVSVRDLVRMKAMGI